MVDRLLNVAQVAEVMGVGPHEVRRKIREGKFPVPVIRQLGSIRVSERALQKWIDTAGEVPRGPVAKVSVPRGRAGATRATPAGSGAIPFPARPKDR